MAQWKDLDITNLSVAELRQLAGRLDAELADRQEAGKRWLRQHGLVEKQGPRYRNPRNAAETWSGRGSPPAWVEEALAKGHTLESLAAESAQERDLPVRSSRPAG